MQKQSTLTFPKQIFQMRTYTLYAAMSWEQFLFFLMLLLVPVNFQWRRKAESAFFCRQVIKSFFGNSSVPRYCSTCSTDQQPYNRNHQKLVFPDCKVLKISHAQHTSLGTCIYKYSFSYFQKETEVSEFLKLFFKCTKKSTATLKLKC